MHHATNNMKMESTGIRLEKKQIDGLKAEAEKFYKKTKMKCHWQALVRLAVDEFLESKRARKLAAV